MGVSTSKNVRAAGEANRAAGRDKEDIFDAFVVKLLNMSTDKFMTKRRAKFVKEDNKRKGIAPITY